MNPKCQLIAAAVVVIFALCAVALMSLPVDSRTLNETAATHFYVDPNTADDATLALLPGIGPSLAKRIIADRQDNGPYRQLNDLERVRGLGPATVRSLAPFVKFSQ